MKSRLIVILSIVLAIILLPVVTFFTIKIATNPARITLEEARNLPIEKGQRICTAEYDDKYDSWFVCYPGTEQDYWDYYAGLGFENIMIKNDFFIRHFQDKENYYVIIVQDTGEIATYGDFRIFKAVEWFLLEDLTPNPLRTLTWPENEVINFGCENLESAIREEIGKPSGKIHAIDVVNVFELSLPGLEITDISALSYFINLKYLYINENKISDITPLANLERLVCLNLDNNMVVDLSPLTNLPNLKELSIKNNRICNLPSLTNLKDLRNLDLTGNRISDISPLMTLANLTFLSLNENEISDIFSLTGLQNLRCLYLQDTEVSDISILSCLGNMYCLRLSGKEITDISALSDLHNLVELSLTHTGIRDLSPLVGLSGLTTLDLEDYGVIDLSQLTNIPNLEFLFIESKSTIDILPLANIKTLKRVDLGDTPIINANTPNADRRSDLDFEVGGIEFEIWVVEEN